MTTDAGNALLRHRPVGAEARREDGDLDRVDHHVVRRRAPRSRAKPRPGAAPSPTAVSARRSLGKPAGCQTSNHQDPSSCGSMRLHGAAEADRLVDRLLHERAPARLLHHRRGDVARGDDAVLRRGRGVHHERVVEPRDVELASSRRSGRGSSRPARSAASSLCVEWVAKVIACGERVGMRRGDRRGSRRRTRGSSRRRTRPRRSAAPRPRRRATP